MLQLAKATSEEPQESQLPVFESNDKLLELALDQLEVILEAYSLPGLSAYGEPGELSKRDKMKILLHAVKKIEKEMQNERREGLHMLRQLITK